jgi:hypothetical protein
MIDSDQPKDDPDDDLFGHADFAKMLARSVLNGSPTNGFVVGIYGSWGLGKSTLLNFIDHFARAIPAERNQADDALPLVVVRFNPWWFSGREDLVRRFFFEVEKSVLAADLSRKRAKDKVVKSLRSLGKAAAKAAPALAYLAPNKMTSDLIQKSAGLLEHLSSTNSSLNPQDVVEKKRELDAALSKSAMRILVLVDEIDRLLPDEMVEVFRLVRSVGDLTGINYVLAFDRDVVVSGLEAQFSMDGARYLEKIIQAPFELPKPYPFQIQRLLTRRLDLIVADTDPVLMDHGRWQRVFLRGIAPYLLTPRDALRLGNTVAVTYPGVRAEVNFVDFVALETLRVFEPTFYDLIRSHKEEFLARGTFRSHSQDPTKDFHATWLKLDWRSAGAVRELFRYLFPEANALIDQLSHDLGSSRRSRRVCLEQCFDLYFRYSPGYGLSRAAFLELLKLDAPELEAELGKFAKPQLEESLPTLRMFLDLFLAELDGGTIHDPARFLPVLCHIGDSPDTTANLSDGPDRWQLARAIKETLRFIAEPSRPVLLRESLTECGIETTCMIVHDLGREHERDAGEVVPMERRIIASEDDVLELKALAISKIEQACASGELWTVGQLPTVLAAWGQFGQSTRMRDALSSWLSEDEQNLWRFLERFVDYSRSTPGIWNRDMPLLEELTDVDWIAERLQNSASGSAQEEETKAAFRRAYGAIAPIRAENRARSEVLMATVAESCATGWFPELHWLQTMFPERLEFLDKLESEGLLAQVANNLRMVTVRGLQSVSGDQRAAQELRVLRELLNFLQTQYASAKATTLDLSWLATKGATNDGPSLNDLQRAALRLVVHISSGDVVRIRDNEGAQPLIIEAGSNILKARLP